MVQEKIRVAINGFGRIGRQAFKIALDRPKEIEVVAINDLGDTANLAYLLKYDTAYGRYEKEVEATDGEIKVDGAKFPVLREMDPAKLPWAKMKVDVVIESTGVFTEVEKAKAHIAAGAKRVVISAPAKGEGFKTVLVGVNDAAAAEAESKVTSDASCTTNALVPVMDIMHKEIGIEKGILTTCHAYTATQGLVDGPSKKDFRRGRAAAMNLVPSTTGAAKAATEIITELKGRFDGISFRIPLITGSIVDFTFVTSRDTTVEEINEIFRKAARKPQYKRILTVTEEPLVSSDIIGDPHASIVDLNWTRVVGGNLAKVVSWYDNEWGYSYTLINHVERVGRLAQKS